jgi:hypothetical protein
MFLKEEGLKCCIMHTLLLKRKTAYLFYYELYTVWVYVYTVHMYIHMSICLSVSIHLINSSKQILHKKPKVGQLVKKLPAHYGPHVNINYLSYN